MWRRTALMGMVLAGLMLATGCATGQGDPGVAGPYKTWDEVISRWIGKHYEDLQIELGPPTFHQQEARDGYRELMWDLTIPSLPGQAEMYDTLPLYGGVSCKLVYLVNPDGIIEAGRRIGCD